MLQANISLSTLLWIKFVLVIYIQISIIFYQGISSAPLGVYIILALLLAVALLALMFLCMVAKIHLQSIGAKILVMACACYIIFGNYGYKIDNFDMHVKYLLAMLVAITLFWPESKIEHLEVETI